MTTRMHCQRTKLRKMPAKNKTSHTLTNRRTKLTTKLNNAAGHQIEMRTKLNSRPDSTLKLYSPSL